MTTAATRPPAPPGRSQPLAGTALATLGMVCVGSSVGVSTLIVDAPLFTVQAVRYLLAAGMLFVLAALTGHALPRPRGREWLWLCGVAGLGLVLFNIGVVRGVEHAEPAVIGVAVAAVPLVLAVVGPLAAGRRPSGRVVLGASVVTVGAVLVEGGGRADLAGLGYAALVLVCEAGFTLCAVPVLTRLGPWAVSLHAVWLAAAALVVLGIAVEGPLAVTMLDLGDLLAATHLAAVVTALAFVVWYSAVGLLGAEKAGLFTGVVPVSAAAVGLLLGGPMPAPVVWAGTVVVALGVAIGMGARAVSPGGGSGRTSAARTSP